MSRLKRRAAYLRGGSWNNNAQNVRAANRNNNTPDNRNNNNGFRIARTPNFLEIAFVTAARCVRGVVQGRRR